MITNRRANVTNPESQTCCWMIHARPKKKKMIISEINANVLTTFLIVIFDFSDKLYLTYASCINPQVTSETIPENQTISAVI